MNDFEQMRPADKKDKVQTEPVAAGGTASVKSETSDDHFDMSIVWKTALVGLLAAAAIAILFF